MMKIRKFGFNLKHDEIVDDTAVDVDPEKQAKSQQSPNNPFISIDKTLFTGNN